jgi:dTDP-4-amino-4,6-dideoxygalactose transaminase
MDIPLVDLSRQHATIEPEIDAAIAEVVDSCRFIGGPKLEAFEREFAAFCGTEYAVGTSSGTTALHVAMVAARLEPGDEVITTPQSFIATIEPITQCGAKPVFVDIDADSYTLDPEGVGAAVTERTKAILPVHLYGQCAEMDALIDIAERHGLVVIEDAAQAHGATYGGRPAGSMGKLGCFSFFPGKNLGAFGDGGAVVTSDPDLADFCSRLVNHGRKDKYEHLVPGFNYRMDALQAAVLSAKLPHLGKWVAGRRRVAARYRELLADAPVKLPAELPEREHAYHLFVVQVLDAERDAVFKRLNDRGIGCGMHYPVPLHLQPAYASLGHKKGDFPVTEALSDRGISLPMFAELTDEEIEYVAGELRAALED